MLTDRKGKRVSPLDGPSAPPPPEVVDTVAKTVGGFTFAPNGQRWDSRMMISVPCFVCQEIHAELVNHGAHWSCTLCQSGGTGDTAELALRAAYKALDARVDKLTMVLNAVHERSGTT